MRSRMARSSDSGSRTMSTREMNLLHRQPRFLYRQQLGLLFSSVYACFEGTTTYMLCTTTNRLCPSPVSHPSKLVSCSYLRIGSEPSDGTGRALSGGVG